MRTVASARGVRLPKMSLRPVGLNPRTPQVAVVAGQPSRKATADSP